MKKPHVHAELIKAWADGAEIEYVSMTGKWHFTNMPSWNLNDEYRIKPETKPDVVMYCNANIGETNFSKFSVDNLKLTFDGTTNKLIKAEVI